MEGKGQSERLTSQQKSREGVKGIFNKKAKLHDNKVFQASLDVMKRLETEFPTLTFRHRNDVGKKEINEALHKIDPDLGQVLFLVNARVKPDGGILEVKDDNGEWRIILVSEAKYQGKDIENIKKGKFVGKNNDQFLMAAGNAIERAHKNIREFANLMLGESHFPYVLFLEGSNFLTENVTIKRPDGSDFTITYTDGTLNRLDRLTASNYGMPINTNLSENKFVSCKSSTFMLQAASIYAQGNGGSWTNAKLVKIMISIARTSLQMISKDLFLQLTKRGDV